MNCRAAYLFSVLRSSGHQELEMAVCFHFPAYLDPLPMGWKLKLNVTGSASLKSEIKEFQQKQGLDFCSSRCILCSDGK